MVSTTLRLLSISNTTAAAAAAAVVHRRQQANNISKKNGPFLYYGILTFTTLLGSMMFPIMNNNDNDDDDSNKDNNPSTNTTNTFSPSAVWSLQQPNYPPRTIVRKNIPQEDNMKNMIIHAAGQKREENIARPFLYYYIIIDLTKSIFHYTTEIFGKMFPPRPLSAIMTMLMTSPMTSSCESPPAAVAAKSSSSSSSSGVVCPSYGCPLTTQDIWDSTVQQALKSIRGKPKDTLRSRQSMQNMLIKLESSGDEVKATLALTGYKGGNLDDQINQDRGLVISPYLYDSNSTEEKKKHSSTKIEGEIQQQAHHPLHQSRLMGVFDGHALYGERVAEFCMTELPKLLAAKLSKRLKSDMERDEQDLVVKKALEETFVELDEGCGSDGEHGGCTATVILQLGSRLFVANTGDSRSFICIHHSATGYTDIAYTTNDHKPSLPEERARVEKMGGEIWQPSYGQGSARVVFRDPNTGTETGLAMSRSIGDRDISQFGVIPDPHVDIIDIEKLVKKEIWTTIYENEQISLLPPIIEEKPVDDVHIFAVSATDGMMDILTSRSIATYLVSSICEENGEHLLTACERLISMAADGWQRAGDDGRYRDDIAISVSKIRSPPPKQPVNK